MFLCSSLILPNGYVHVISYRIFSNLRKILYFIQTVQEILGSGGKPQRISLRLIKTKSGLKSFDLQLDKLPLTKLFINSVIETPMDLHKRRIQWAIEKLNKEGKALTISNITVMTGVGNKYRKLVIEEIKKALEELGER